MEQMTYFLKDVAQYLLSRSEGRLQDTLVVFPNRRARLFFNHFLSQLCGTPLWAPRYYTISDYIQQLSGLMKADSLTLLFRLYKVFRDVTGSGESFDTFYFYCEMILADFDDIDKYRVRADQLYTNLSDLKAIDDYSEYLDEYQLKTLKEFWEIVNRAKPSEEKQEFITIWDALLRIYREFNRQLDAEGIAYEGRAYRKAIDIIQSEGSDQEQTVAFVGFNALNHSEELLFDHFRKQGNGLFFWDHDRHYLEKEYHEAGFFLQKYLKRFPEPADFESGMGKPYRPAITTVAVPSNLSQAKVLQQCFHLLGDEDIESPLQTALILADESLLIPVVNSLPPNIEGINISMGYPLTDTPVYSLIDLLADLQKNRRNSPGGTVEYYNSDLFAVLHHELVSPALNHNELSLFENKCNQENRIFIPAAELPFGGVLTETLLKMPDQPMEFVSYLRNIIELIAHRLLESEQTQAAQWQLELLKGVFQSLTRFEALLDDTNVELSLSAVLNLIRKLLRGISIPFSGEPLLGLQVMGLLETRTLDFKNLIILSMNEGKLPKSGHAPSFIPFALREAFGLPTIRHQDAIFSYYFYRLLHRSENVVLVYNTRTEGMQKGEPSRYIQQLRFESEQVPAHIDLGYTIAPFPVRSITAYKDQRVLQKLARYSHPEAKAFLSPSALTTYLHCRLRFFFRYLEGIPEPEVLSESIGPDVFGSILHKSMQLLYEPWLDRELITPEITGIRKNRGSVDSALDQAFREEYFRMAPDRALSYKGRNILVREVIRSYMEGILKYDEANAPFHLMGLEQLEIITLALGAGGGAIRLGGYIDRLDRKGGTLRIIDYKTGKKELHFQSVDSLFSKEADHTRDPIFQSFMYCWMLGRKGTPDPVKPSLYFVREIMQPGFDPSIIHKGEVKTPVVDFSAYHEAFEEQLTGLIAEIMNPAVPFEQTTDEEKCRYCTFRMVCGKSAM